MHLTVAQKELYHNLWARENAFTYKTRQIGSRQEGNQEQEKGKKQEKNKYKIEKKTRTKTKTKLELK